MTITTIAPLSAVWVGITAAIILISRDWRVSISALGAQYVGIFILVAVVWPLEYAVIKLVAGWIAAAVLGMGLMERPDAWKQETGYGLSAVLFRVFIAGFVVLVVLSIAPDVSNWILSATRNQILGALFLIGLGLLHLGLTSQPMRVILGLLTVLSGFEILYATMETSLLLNGFLAAITLGIALVGGFILAVPELEA